MAPPAVLIPSARFSALLAEVRAELGADLDEMSARSAGRFHPSDLAAFEAGVRSVDEATVEAVARLYGVESRLLAPSRGDLVIDLVRGEVISGDHHVPIPSAADGPVDVLEGYLEMVCALRGAPRGSQLPLRTPDLEVLSEGLEIGVPDVTAELRRLMAPSPADEVDTGARLRRRLLPVAGLLAAAAAVTGIVLAVNGGDSGTRPTPVSGPAPAAPGDPSPSDRQNPPAGSTVEGGSAGTDGAAVPPLLSDPFAPMEIEPGETSVEVPPIRYERDEPTDPPGEVEVIGE